MAAVPRFPFQKLGHAEDACKRRAHVVGHVGEKGAFRAVGGFGQFLFAVDLEGGPADADHPHNADEPEGLRCGALAFRGRRQKGFGGKGDADAPEHVPALLVLMALQAVFLGLQGSHVAVLRNPFARFHQLESVVPALLEGEERARFPRIGPVAGAFGGKARNAEARQRRGEAFGNLAGHVGGVDLDQRCPVRRAQGALLFGQPRVGRTDRRFTDPDAAIVRVPVARVFDA